VFWAFLGPDLLLERDIFISYLVCILHGVFFFLNVFLVLKN